MGRRGDRAAVNLKTPTKSAVTAHLRLGLKANWRQFSLLVIVNAFVGGMVGLERTVLPLLAEQDFNVTSRTAILSFIVSFGITKAVANLLAGRLSDRVGRKPLLIAGWLVGLPVPFLVIHAPSWEWIVFANGLLGINQGLCWSTTVIMKIDLVGPTRRGLAMGLNEFAGYLAVSVTAMASGYLATAYSLRPEPFYLGVVFAVAGLLLSLLFVRESHGHAAQESIQLRKPAKVVAGSQSLSFWRVLWLVSWKDRNLFSASQAGLVNNLNDGMAWGLLPVFFASKGLSLGDIATLTAIYPGVWGVTQLLTGALSDRVGRKILIETGMWVQALGISLILLAASREMWIAAMALLGVGTAMVYPTLLAVVSDVAQPQWRASAVGVYRFWRDSGYVVGALLAGLLADLFGMGWAMGSIGILTFASGVVVLWSMQRTLSKSSDQW